MELSTPSVVVPTPQFRLGPSPATDVTAEDAPNDVGGAIVVNWKPSPDEGAGLGSVTAYTLLRSTSLSGPFDTVGTMTSGMTSFIDGGVLDGVDYYYIVDAISIVNGVAGFMTLSVRSEPSVAVQSHAQWFHKGRINALIAVIILSGSILYFITQAKSGRELFIRKIAGLEAVDEAVGRATEMGREIFFVPGIEDMNNVQTIAGVTILGRVAKMAATYDAKLDVPVRRSLVMVAGRETVKEAYLDAGRPDAYHDDMVHYLTDDQFGYAAGVDGMVVRRKPATIFYMGAFYAESLILAETGNSIGAIQIAGTAQPAQLPFFVAACDYTLIGEELFAASAYLSKEPRQLGSLKGQDVGKFFILAFAIIGILLATFNLLDMSHWFTVN
ncbi:MAG TPA: fibronectin type III domain-containing protein [candidate division Zixibacteria bacterium]